jgi:uncharacterized protein YoxC
LLLLLGKALVVRYFSLHPSTLLFPHLLQRAGFPSLLHIVQSHRISRLVSRIGTGLIPGLIINMQLTSVLTCGIMLQLTTALSYYHSPSADAAPTANLDTIFQYTTSRNHKVISQAVNFVVSMQTAPTCTRMAASHLMNECKLLEHAPDFVKSRPEAYLDNVKTEYAAKLAVCELLSAQPPSNAVPPLHCDILVPSSKACSKGGWWSQTPAVSDKQCYPDYKDHQYSQCLKTLQSSPQYWTSFSNARQNAVVMCQASRDAIERENHLETFKNLTQVMGAVSSNIKQTTEEYATILRDQKQSANELQESQTQLKKDMTAVQEKALATMDTLDSKFHDFLESSISGLITALADSQSTEITRIREEMQVFSQDMIVETSQFAKSLTTELQYHHDRALISLQINHEAQVESYQVLSSHMDGIADATHKIHDTANSSLAKIDNIESRLDRLSSKAEHIARGFAFFSTLPKLVALLVRTLVVTAGATFVLTLLYQLNKGLAIYIAGACSAAYLLHLCGVYDFLARLPSRAAAPHLVSSILDNICNLTATQKGAGFVIVLWLATYPVSRINTIINYAITRFLSPYFIRQYSNSGGFGILPSIEIPHFATHRKRDTLESCVDNDISLAARRGAQYTVEP